MAKLWITELSRQGRDGELAVNIVPIAQLPALTTQVVTFTTTTQSAALGAVTSFVRVISDTDCHIVAGANPTATTSDLKMIAGMPEYFGVIAGQKIAAVAA